MKFSQIFTAATLAAGATAAPTESTIHANGKRALEAIQKRSPTVTNEQVLNFALTLEHLEAAFYKEAVHNYTSAMFTSAGFPSSYYTQVVRLQDQEATHVNFLTGALKAGNYTANAACSYSFPSTDVKSFAAVAQILEGVGVSAYSGAAQYIASATYLTAAADILSVEARHSAYLRNYNGLVAYPSVFDIPLTPSEVLTLASPFITSCPPGNMPLVGTAYAPLSLSSSQAMPISVGNTVTLVLKSAPKAAVTYACWPLLTGPVCGPAKQVGALSYSTTVPMGGVTGQGYVLLTSANSLSDDTIVAGPAIVETLPPNPPVNI